MEVRVLRPLGAAAELSPGPGVGPAEDPTQLEGDGQKKDLRFAWATSAVTLTASRRLSKSLVST